MPKFHQFDGFQLDVRSRDHNPPHFHAIGPDFHALIRIDTLEILRGNISRKSYKQAIEFASEHQNELAAEWRRLNERG